MIKFTFIKKLFLFSLLSFTCHFQNLSSLGTSVSDTDWYRSFCYLAATNDLMFQSFKSHPAYQKILEHVTQNQGKEYLQCIESKYPHLLAHWKKFATNDLIGQPVTYHYDLIGKTSPTTIRYVKTLGDIQTLLGSLSHKTILEIGGGYGGQCKIISDLFDFEKYCLVDLPEPLLLTEKYLSLAIPEKRSHLEFISSDELIEKHYDVVISNYAFSECSLDIQMEYLDKYILNSSCGYLLYNGDVFQTMPAKQIEKILKEHGYHVIIEKEQPLTAPGNLQIVWIKYP